MSTGTTRNRPQKNWPGQDAGKTPGGTSKSPSNKPGTTRDSIAGGKLNKAPDASAAIDSPSKTGTSGKLPGASSPFVADKPASIKSPTSGVNDVRSSQRRKGADAAYAAAPFNATTAKLKDPSVTVNSKGYVGGGYYNGGYNSCGKPYYSSACGNGHWNSGCDNNWNNCAWNNGWNSCGWGGGWWGWGSGWGFSIGFGSCNSWIGFSYSDYYPCRPYYWNSWYCGSPYYWYGCAPVASYSYYPWWSSGWDYGTYQPTYITNNYYNYGEGYTTTPPSSSQPSQYNDYSWLDGNSGGGATLGQNDYSWLESDNSATQTSDAQQSQSGLMETWSAPQRELSTVEEGWTQFGSGDAHEARRVFLRAADGYPRDGAPQVGLALASSQLNRWTDAVTALRRAARIDPESLNKVPNDPTVIQSINSVLDHYKAELKRTPFDADALFMTAAMQYLLGQDAVAYVTIDDAIDRAGDKDESASQLKRLIRDALNTGTTPNNGGTNSAPSTLSPGSLNIPPLSAPQSSPATTAPVRKQDIPF